MVLGNLCRCQFFVLFLLTHFSVRELLLNNVLLRTLAVGMDTQLRYSL